MQDKPKISVISLFYTPEPIGISRYTGELTAWLAHHGFDIRVITAFPFYPQWRLYPGYPTWRYYRENLDGVKVFRCPLWVPARVNGIKRIVHLLSFAISSSLATLAQCKWKPDLVLLVIPTILNVPAALALAWMCHSRTWLHVQDFELDLAMGLNLLSGERRLRAWLQGLESLVLAPFDRVSTISGRMLERLIEEKRVSPKRAVMFPNWVDPDAIYPATDPSAFRDRLGISQDQVVVLYAGNMGRKYGLEVLAEAARKAIDRSEIVFVLCGDGAARSELEEACHSLPNVHFLPVQPEKELNALLNLADIHVLPQRANAADSVMPSKLLGMLASERPVVATVAPETEIAAIVKQCGIVVPPGDTDALVAALLTLSSDNNLRQRLGREGRKLVAEHFGKEAVLHSFVHQIRALLNE